jgi:hypothetical protein
MTSDIQAPAPGPSAVEDLIGFAISDEVERGEIQFDGKGKALVVQHIRNRPGTVLVELVDVTNPTDRPYTRTF